MPPATFSSTQETPLAISMLFRSSGLQTMLARDDLCTPYGAVRPFDSSWSMQASTESFQGHLDRSALLKNERTVRHKPRQPSCLKTLRAGRTVSGCAGSSICGFRAQDTGTQWVLNVHRQTALYPAAPACCMYTGGESTKSRRTSCWESNTAKDRGSFCLVRLVLLPIGQNVLMPRRG